MKGKELCQFGSGTIVLQNLLIFSFLVLPEISELTFYLDIIGFFILGIGLILYSKEDTVKDRSFTFISGGMILMWVVFRIYWQFLIQYEIADFQNLLTGAGDLLSSFIGAFLMGGLSLLIGSILLFKGFKGTGSFAFLIYSVINFFAIVMIAIPFLFIDIPSLFSSVIAGVAIKGIVVPFMGIVSFYYLYNQFEYKEKENFDLLDKYDI